ncbi:MAG: phosphonate metabolism protein/1,5-bisphosphokinase (PRPP-forming) PhnN [Pseudomonadota bacterium]
MSGRLIAVVGPSGVGKDTVMAGLVRRRPDLHLVRRVITRPEALGGEPFVGVDTAEFARRRDAGAFALHWEAHGLAYGIPAAVDAVLRSGQDALVNLSRGKLLEADRRFQGLVVLSLTAKRETLAARLSARGRESDEDIARRLDRAEAPLPEGLTILSIANDDALEDTLSAALAALYPESAARAT